MISSRLARKGREWISTVAHHSRLSAAAAWLLASMASLVVLWQHLQRPDPELMQEWIELASLIVQPFLVALLVYLTLRFAAEQEHVEIAARRITAEANRRTR